MRKIINDPSLVEDQTVEGILAAFPGYLKRVEGSTRSLVRADAPVDGKVGIATGGGSGHLPLFAGYVGKGLATGVCVGNVFSSPSSEDMLDVTKAVDSGAGVLYLYGNYSGDTMNFDMAAEMADMEGIAVKTTLGRDDVTSAPNAEMQRRRGVAGIFFGFKIAGAAAEEGRDLDGVHAAAEKAVFNTRSMGVALSGTTIPAVGKAGFEVREGEMELGMGIHGEPGVQVGPLLTADEIAGQMLDRILPDLPFSSGDTTAVLVNSLGATAPEELYILYNKASQILSDRGIKVHRAFIGEYATSMEMSGASISLCKLDDDMTKLLDAPAYSPLLSQQVGR
ncbi:MAG: dihydroxyacetone kinase subunit DhaK [Chloroflexi bacterium]|nr:dihydroxyacetone kinase subunit DhaK [Chloroflexota bacterium]MCI0835106.1 dihydroxyacetone kinase subunit DhaK [Chloroflexota bacterium]MCI0871996.1 dihydroxyacetone kinase subunit DhaK [Chloroflexota bacterium]MCI0882319.1 dihydroxyacetone kinase subunit DhaK [Chloroflexota bacterium]